MLEENSNTRDQIDVIDLVINCLVEHEKKLDQFINEMESGAVRLDLDEVGKFGVIQLYDKRGPYWKNLGSIIQRKQKMNSLELSTDKGYTLCLSCDFHGFIPSPSEKNRM